ncbi:MAG TPA: twin-arginine translocation signal domain-containing protein, partial [Blastocatellia bacterium]|nr:twin-arginine translocation signal domain-containing protein [Blastocatellia bacterium]
MFENKNKTNRSGQREEAASSRKNTNKGATRRQFLGHAGAAAALVAGALKAPPAAFAQEVGVSSVIPEATPKSVKKRIHRASALRKTQADQDAGVRATNADNGDNALYADKGGTYTKGLLHDSFGRVDAASFASFQTALNSGDPSDFKKLIMGGTRTENGPQGGLAFCMQALDSAQFGQPQVPPAPPIAGDVTGFELLEHYWAS